MHDSLLRHSRSRQSCDSLSRCRLLSPPITSGLPYSVLLPLVTERVHISASSPAIPPSFSKNLLGPSCSLLSPSSFRRSLRRSFLFTAQQPSILPSLSVCSSLLTAQPSPFWTLSSLTTDSFLQTPELSHPHTTVANNCPTGYGVACYTKLGALLEDFKDAKKLGALLEGFKDVEKCTVLDPSFSKGQGKHIESSHGNDVSRNGLNDVDAISGNSSGDDLNMMAPIAVSDKKQNNNAPARKQGEDVKAAVEFAKHISRANPKDVKADIDRERSRLQTF
ncbi:hypothetical protein ZIOFF_054867 [Zingiber officinale]|uniref:Uncharacterized protein n=1 Tax=Zingiber officinale TaxID=94328 RepID=A0A8J5FF08_ZINOF|nr:hypothetical protein ZIOFF_054867 [Zingiber officinale]